MNTALDTILARLENVKAAPSGGWEAYCPAHGDTRTRHLTVNEGDRQDVITKCHHKADCSYEAILEALDLTRADLYPRPAPREGKTAWHIRDERGRSFGEHRRVDRGGKKRVSWADPDGEPGLNGTRTEALPLYGSELLGDYAPEAPLVLVEGEKAADALLRVSIPALGTVTGAAGVPIRERMAVLAGRKVVCWPDNDDEGREHMDRCAKMLATLGADVRVFTWPGAPEKGDAADRPLDDPAEVLALARALEAAPRWVPNPSTPGARGTAELHYRFIDYLDRRDAGGGVTGIRSGIPKLDRELSGFNPGHSYVIAARTGAGKSLFCGQIALTVAQQGKRVLLATPEMADLEIHVRMVCYLAGVDYFRWKQRERTTPDERVKMVAASEQITHLPYFYNPDGGQTLDDVARDIEDWEPDLVIVDYVQFLRSVEGAKSEYERITEVAEGTTAIKSAYGVPVIVAAQLNRNLEYRPKAEPELSDIRGSGVIEHGADAVLMLHRPDQKNGDDPGQEEVQLICQKNRMGTLFKMPLWFQPGQNWLTDKRRITQ